MDVLNQSNRLIHDILRQPIFNCLKSDTSKYMRENKIERIPTEELLLSQVQENELVSHFYVCYDLANQNIIDAELIYNTWDIVKVYEYFAMIQAKDYTFKRV